MQIPFRRVTAEAQAFSLKRGELVMEGAVRKRTPLLVLMEAEIKGTLEVDCFRCADSFDIILDEEVSLLISDGIYHGQDEQYDVVEMYDGSIDLDAVFESEIAMLESDYHACGKCSQA